MDSFYFFKESILQKTSEKKATAANQESLKELVLSAIDDAKGNDIKVIDVSHHTQLLDYMIIASGTSSRHIQTIAEFAMKKAQENGYDKPATEGLGHSEWVVVDFVDVVLHVMSPAAREHYNIEGLWEISSRPQDS